MMFIEQSTSERREAKRFPIERELRYRVLLYDGREKEGTGTSVNISSGGILFATDDHLEPGSRVEVTVSWPVLSDTRLPLELVGLGRVVRSERGRVAIGFQRQQLRSLSVEPESQGG